MCILLKTQVGLHAIDCQLVPVYLFIEGAVLRPPVCSISLWKVNASSSKQRKAQAYRAERCVLQLQLVYVVATTVAMATAPIFNAMYSPL